MSVQAHADSISGQKRCTMKGLMSLKSNGSNVRLKVAQNLDYIFNVDGTYTSLNYSLPDSLGHGTWSQNGRRFTINSDLEALKDSALQQCRIAADGSETGCSVAKMNVSITGISNPRTGRMNGVVSVDQEISYNNPSIIVIGAAKLKLACLPM